MTISSKLIRRHPLDRWHALARAEFGEIAGMAAPIRYPQSADANRCALADLSALPRIGVKGWHVWRRLRELGLACPQTNNTACVQKDHGLCLRLGDNEAFLLDSLREVASRTFGSAEYETSNGFYPVPRNETHAWLLLVGAAIPSVLAKVCAIDFRLHKFRQLEVSQTSAAGVGAVIVRADMRHIPAFHLLVDATSAAYLWNELLHAAREYDGYPIGLLTLRQLDSLRSDDMVI